MSTLDPNEIMPRLRRKLTQMHGTVFITESTFGTGVDLDLAAHRRRRRRLKHRRWVRRQQRRYQTLVVTVQHAFGMLIRLRRQTAHQIEQHYMLGYITERQLRRQLAQLYIVRARLGR